MRVPALLVSPLVKPGSTSTTLLGPDFHLDHTSIMKTIFTRFCRRDGQIPAMTARAAAANHLGHLLVDGGPRADVPDHCEAVKTVVGWRAEFTHARFKDPIAAVNPPRVLTDYQNELLRDGAAAAPGRAARRPSVTATRNLARLAEAAFERRGDYESLLFEGRWHGSADLFDRACRLAGGLADLGIGPGERVVVSMANCAEVGIVYQALWRAGAVVTPATFLLSSTDLRHVVADSEASAVITTPDLLDKVREAVDGLECVRHVISTRVRMGPESSRSVSWNRPLR